MCSRFDLNTDIRAFQARLALDMDDLIHNRAGHFATSKRNDDKMAATGPKSASPPDARNDASQNGRHDGAPQNGEDEYYGEDENSLFNGLAGIKRPTDPVFVVIPAWSLSVRKWGFAMPQRREDAPDTGQRTGNGNGNSNSLRKGPLINARAETLDQKPTFRPLLQRRCLVPATGWFEWRKDGPQRFKNHITLPDHQPFFFAGLENGDEVVIITCAPSPTIAHIHNRMPAIIGPGHIHHWLNPDREFAAVRHMLGPLPDNIVTWHEETPKNSSRSGANCVSTNQFGLF
ncbi:SOS response-associated peptidase [Thalassospira mesophila]|uniref:Abasic site processing protein n=1 Tax=Thalassospira mesophila TaxID=1293891 RepID=A0A1Y2KWI4_9PROT|nr:SOS response-associated peptidase [Thalassospira mesophila]OSQ36548.1 hypothetical protein TMES_17305 [Thalassospira mesophila]